MFQIQLYNITGVGTSHFGKLYEKYCPIIYEK